MRGYIVHEDRRFTALEEMLEQAGDNTLHSLIDYQNFDYIVFGLKGPDASLRYLEDGQTRRLCNDFFKALKPGCRLYSFINSPFLRQMAKKYALVYEAFELNETVVNGNAQLTSEAVLAHLIAHRPWQLKGAAITIWGYGHLAKSLVSYLQPIASSITIACRSRAYDKEIETFGTACQISAVSCLKSDILINTVPARIIHEPMLKAIKKDAVLLDISSFPYGFDLDEALSLGVNAEILPGLPSKYAYKEAAKLLFHAVMEGRKC